MNDSLLLKTESLLLKTESLLLSTDSLDTSLGVATDILVGVAMETFCEGEAYVFWAEVGLGALKKCLMGVVITGGGLGNLRGAVSTLKDNSVNITTKKINYFK